GSQTLARGLTILLPVAESRGGMTIQEVASRLGVHRSIAYRSLQTLADFGLLTRREDGTYGAGARLASLANTYLPSLREIATPEMRSLANAIGATVSLFVAEGREAVAITTGEPTNVLHHISFRPGMRTPTDRGAAGYALLSSLPESDGDPDAVKLARKRGYATSYGEVEPGAYGIAAPIGGTSPRACLNVITYQREQANSVSDALIATAKAIAQALS